MDENISQLLEECSDDIDAMLDKISTAFGNIGLIGAADLLKGVVDMRVDARTE